MKKLFWCGTKGSELLLRFNSDSQLYYYLIKEQVTDWFEKEYRVYHDENRSCRLGDYLYTLGLCDGSYSELLEPPKHIPVFGNDEYIVCAAVKFGEKMICGYRHSDCHELMNSLFGEGNYPEAEKGSAMFLTSKKRYVSRAEAHTIALANNQYFLRWTEDVPAILTSEDLYHYVEDGLMR